MHSAEREMFFTHTDVKVTTGMLRFCPECGRVNDNHCQVVPLADGMAAYSVAMKEICKACEKRESEMPRFKRLRVQAARKWKLWKNRPKKKKSKQKARIEA